MLDAESMHDCVAGEIISEQIYDSICCLACTAGGALITCLIGSVVPALSVVKVPILQHLESLRDEELEERREKRRRQLAEEEETAKQNESSAAGEETREQSLQVKEGKCEVLFWEK